MTSLVSLSLLQACSLEEVTVVDVEDVVVAEVLLQLHRAPGMENRLTAFLHRTVGGAGPGFHEVPGASIVVSREGDFSVEMAETTLDGCVVTVPEGGTGTCYVAAPAAAARFLPGDRLEVRIELQEGGTIFGSSRVPGDFVLLNVPDGGPCIQPRQTPLEVRWSSSEGAWAYVNETSVMGLADVFAPAGIEVADTLYLLGLSVSAADTTIVFPGEFGVFNRFELERAVSLQLQEGLPADTRADVSITAADRNYVNWVRGGNFNPSGQVRVPSLTGDGTGLFGTVVSRSFSVAVDPGPEDPEAGAPACLP
jgi:hypothetical protein